MNKIKINKISDMLMRVRQFKRRIKNWLDDVLPSESITASKRKWNNLASKNARYFIMSDYGEDINEQLFKESGEKDVTTLIDNDPILHARLDPFFEQVVVEIGCGVGRLTEYLSARFKNIIGLDISDVMIKNARKRLSDKKNTQFFSTDGLIYPMASGTANLVFSFIVFQHMPDKKTVRKNLEESARVLKKGGIMKVQLRGLPTKKKYWFYGPTFDIRGVKKILEGLPFFVIKTEGENEKYFWLWLERV